MPVVINDFEIVSDQSPARGSESTTPAPTPPTGGGQTPHDLENILRHEKERLLRVQAH
jgi:hypothetical protein